MMQKPIRRVLVGLLLLCLYAPAVRADIDQRCLGVCTQNGQSSALCLSQCTFNIKKPKTSIPADQAMTGTHTPESHNVLETIQPIGNGVLLPDNLVPKKPLQKDYSCINSCLGEGGQYDFCNQHCAKSTCSWSGNQIGPDQCKDLTGNAPGAASQKAASAFVPRPVSPWMAPLISSPNSQQQ